MGDPIVHDAYTRVRSRYTDDVWFALPPRTITDEIYREMRQIDAERLSEQPAEETPAVFPPTRRSVATSTGRR